MVKKVAFYRKLILFSRFLAQIFFTGFFLLVILLAFTYGRILFKPINLEYIETYLEDNFSSDHYDVDLQGMNIISNKSVGLLGIQIEKMTVKHKKNDSHYILNQVMLDISKRSFFMGALGLNKVIIDHVTSHTSDDYGQSKLLSGATGQFSAYKLLNDYLTMPLMRPLKTLIIQNSQLDFKVPFFQKYPLNIKGKVVKLKRYNNHINITLETILKSKLLGKEGVPATLKTAYNLDSIKSNTQQAPFDVKITLGSKTMQHHFFDNVASGKILMQVNANIRDNLTFEKFNADLHIKKLSMPPSFINKIGFFKINKGFLNVAYNQQNKALHFNIKKFQTNRGDLKGVAVLNKTGDFNMHIKANNFYDGYVYKAPIGLKNVRINGHYNDQKHALNIDNYTIDFKQKTLITGDASLNFTNNKPYHLNTKIENLTIDNLLTIWPLMAARGGRYWAQENLKEADFETAKLHISGNMDAAYPKKVSLVAPINNSRFSYVKPMTMATNIFGRLLIENKKFSAVADKGNIGPLKISNASFVIPDIMQYIPHAYFKSQVKGRLRDGFSLINQKPLYLMRKGGFGYKQATGFFDGELKLNFALLKNVKLDAIKMQSDIKVNNGSLKVGKKQIPLKKIKGRLFVTTDTAKGSGSVSVYGLPATFKWAENFHRKAKVTTDLRLKSKLTHQKILQALPFLIDTEIPFHEYIKGVASLQAHVQLQQSTITKLDVKGDLKNMRLGLDNSLWQVPIGQDKTLTLAGKALKDRFLIHKLGLDSQDLKTDISAMNITHNGIEDFKINSLSFKALTQDATGFYRFKNQKIHAITLKTHAMSFEPIIEFEKNYIPKHIITYTKEYPYFSLQLNADKLTLYPEIMIEKANMNVVRDPFNIHNIAFNIQSPAMKMAKINVVETAPRTRDITIKAENAGNLITQLGLFEKFSGGNLTINMVQNAKTMRGKLHIEDGTILKAPLIAKLMSFASLSGIVDRLNSRGLSIDDIELDFIKKESMISFKNGLIHGSAVGMSFQGAYHSQRAFVDLYGTLVPFYGLNSLLSNIPIIGQITSSRKGEGVVGLSYTVKGKTKQPNISVEPLSILSVGILRRLFE